MLDELNFLAEDSKHSSNRVLQIIENALHNMIRSIKDNYGWYFCFEFDWTNRYTLVYFPGINIDKLLIRTDGCPGDNKNRNTIRGEKMFENSDFSFFFLLQAFPIWRQRTICQHSSGPQSQATASRSLTAKAQVKHDMIWIFKYKTPHTPPNPTPEFSNCPVVKRMIRDFGKNNDLLSAKDVAKMLNHVSK